MRRVRPGDGRGQREGERAASGEGDEGAALLGGDTPGSEQGVGLGGVERSHGQCGEELRPPGVQRPFGVGGDPAGHHHDRVVGEPQQEGLAQPCLEWLALLEGVDEQHRTGFGTRRGRELLEPARVSVEEPSVHVHHAAAGEFGLSGGVAHQRGLADASGAVHVRHERSVRRARQHPVEHRPLRLPAHQRTGSSLRQPARQARRSQSEFLSGFRHADGAAFFTGDCPRPGRRLAEHIMRW